MSHRERDAYFIGPMAVADATGARGGVHIVDVTTSSQSIALPSSWVSQPESGRAPGGPHVRVKVRGAAIRYSFGPEATLTVDPTSALGTGNAACGWPLDDGEVEDAEIPAGATHLNVIGEGACKLFLRCSEGGWV